MSDWDDVPLFHWFDYVVFTISISLSIAVGIYYGFFGKGQKTTEEYLMADRTMSIVPVSLSLFLSWYSAIGFLGDPVEVYYYGAVHWYIGIGYVIGCVTAAIFFAPAFQRLQGVSCYEFLEERWNKPFRIILSMAAIVYGIPYYGIVLYAPSMALSQVTGLNLQGIIVVMGIIILFYSTLGGIKAVMWADSIQFVILCVGYLAMMIGGIVYCGGMAEVWRIADEGGRINFNNFSLSPLERTSFWTYLIGGFFRVFLSYMSTQAFIQRYGTLPTGRAAAVAVLWNAPLFAIVLSCFVLTGLMLFAYFGDCDPVESGRVDDADQMIPLMVMEVLGWLYGIPGLFMAGIFSASMSSMSTAFNSYSACILRDAVEPCYEKCTNGKKISDFAATVIAKITCATLGVLFIILAIVVSYAEGTLFTITVAIGGMFGGPAGAIFFIALLMPWVGTWSAAVSFLVGLAVATWITVGAAVTGATHDTLPIYMYGCPVDNSTTDCGWMTTVFGVTTEEPEPDKKTIYHWAPLLYSCLGFLTTLFIAIFMGGISHLYSRYRKGNYALDSETETDEMKTADDDDEDQEPDFEKGPLEDDDVIELKSATDDVEEHTEANCAEKKDLDEFRYSKDHDTSFTNNGFTHM